MCIAYKTLMEQAGFRKGHRAKEQITSVNESWTAQGSTTKMSICFTDYTKKFKCAALKNVEHHKKYGNNQAFDGVYMRPTYRVRSKTAC